MAAESIGIVVFSDQFEALSHQGRIKILDKSDSKNTRLLDPGIGSWFYEFDANDGLNPLFAISEHNMSQLKSRITGKQENKKPFGSVDELIYFCKQKQKQE